MRYQKDVFRSLTMVFQFSINMLVPILMCTFLGMAADRFLGTSFIVIIMFFIGALAGFTNIFKYVRADSSKKSFLGSDAKSSLMQNVKSQGLEEGKDDNNT